MIGIPREKRRDAILFRRVKQHIVEENWFAVFVDFLIVVLGIIIGFQISNWSENRSNANNYLSLIHI